MRLRRIAGADHGIEDANNGHRHEKAFVENIKKNGLLHEADLLPDSYGGKLHPRAVPALVGSLPSIVKALQRRKVTVGKALGHPHKAPPEVRKIYDTIEGQADRYELNLYVSGTEEDPAPAPGEAVGTEGKASHGSTGGQLPAERSPNL